MEAGMKNSRCAYSIRMVCLQHTIGKPMVCRGHTYGVPRAYDRGRFDQPHGVPRAYTYNIPYTRCRFIRSHPARERAKVFLQSLREGRSIYGPVRLRAYVRAALFCLGCSLPSRMPFQTVAAEFSEAVKGANQPPRFI